MKKLFKTLAFVFISALCFTFTSCEGLIDLLMAAAEDTFKGESNTWLEVKVKYEKDGMKGDAKLAFFYTENAKTGHTNNETKLKEGKQIDPGLTILLSGKFTPIEGSGITELAYYKKVIPLESADLTWALIFRLSPQLRELAEKGTLADDGSYIKGGENYGSYQSWIVTEENKDETVPSTAERVPSPLTNEWDGFYSTNESQAANSDWKPIDWDDSLGKIGLSISSFN